VFPNAHFGQTQGPVWMDRLGCSGGETDMTTCSFSGWGNTQCTHTEDVGIACQQGSMLNSVLFFFKSMRYKSDHNTSHGLSTNMKLIRDWGFLFPCRD
jgi:hypothetical protein